MTSFQIPEHLTHEFDPRHSGYGHLIEEAERLGAHVALTQEGYKVVTDYELTVQKINPIYSAGKGFIIEEMNKT